MLNKKVLDYLNPTGAAGTPRFLMGIRLGRASVALFILLPFSFILGIPVLAAAVGCALGGAIFSRGCSICAWIGLGLSAFFCGVLVWLIVSGH